MPGHGESGSEPVRDWLESKQLEGPKQRAAVAAIEEILVVRGTEVCETEWGENLGQGLYELRVRHTADEIERMFGEDATASEDPPSTGKGEVLLRVYFMTDGPKLVLLLAGYDKGRFGSGKREDEAIARARQRVAVQKRRAQQVKAKRRKGR